MASSGPSIRVATETDAPAIRGLIRQAQLNPRDLDWRRFLVAEEAGLVVACVQVRAHRGGSRELVSAAVERSHRGRGIGRAIAEAAIARELARPLYLYTESRTEAFWAKLGFRTIEGSSIPRDLRLTLLMARVAAVVFTLVMRKRYRMVMMRRDG